MEKEVKEKCGRRSKRKGETIYPKVNIVRFADDFIVTCDGEQDSANIIKVIDEFLMERGLALNKEKTKVTRVTDGFEFLGFNFRTWDNGFIMTPSKKALNRVKEKVRQVLSVRSKSPAQIVKELNPILRGWANYYRVASSTKMFSYLG